MEKVACGFVHIGRVRFRHMERVQRRGPYQAFGGSGLGLSLSFSLLPLPLSLLSSFPFSSVASSPNGNNLHGLSSVQSLALWEQGGGTHTQVGSYVKDSQRADK